MPGRNCTNPTSKKISSFMKLIRADRGMTLEEVNRAILKVGGATSTAHISRIERGLVDIHIGLLCMFMDALDMSTEERGTIATMMTDGVHGGIEREFNENDIRAFLFALASCFQPVSLEDLKTLLVLQKSFRSVLTRNFVNGTIEQQSLE